MMGMKVSESPAVKDLLTSEGIKIVSAARSYPSIATSATSEDKTQPKDGHHHHDEHVINQKVPNHHKILTSLIAGAVAGSVAKTVIAPLDRTKINFQIYNKQYSIKQAVIFIVDSVKRYGVRGLWRGNSATMVRVVPYASIQYASHEQWKGVLNQDNSRYLTSGRRYVAGSLAGVTAVSCTYPLDLVRARMAITDKGKYKTFLHVFMKMYREEGLRTVYRGFTPTILGAIPYAGTSFFTYETLKKAHHDYYGAQQAPSAIERLCFGAIAGLLGQSSSYPLDIVRRRMQTAGLTGHTHDYTSLYSTAKYVIETEGVIGGLYKGLSMNWIKGPIAVGVSFTCFDGIQNFLRRHPIFHDD